MRLPDLNAIFGTRADNPISLFHNHWRNSTLEGYQGQFNKFTLWLKSKKVNCLFAEYAKGYEAGYAQSKADSPEESNDKGAFLKALAKAGVDRLPKQEPDWQESNPPLYDPSELQIELNQQRQRAVDAELALANLQKRVKDILSR